MVPNKHCYHVHFKGGLVEGPLRADLHVDLHLGHREPGWPLTPAAQLKPAPLSEDFTAGPSQLW